MERTKTFQQVAEEWLNLIEATQEVKLSTLQNHKQYSKKIYNAIGKLPINKVVYRVVQEYVLQLSKTYATSTVKNYVSFISNVMQYARRCEYTDKDPCKDLKFCKKSATQRENYTIEEVQEILTYLYCNADLEHKIMGFLLALLGCREGEVMGFEFSDIDYKECTITINRTSCYRNGTTGVYTDTPKTKNGYRVLYIPHFLVEWITELKEQKYRKSLLLGDMWVSTDRLFTKANGDIPNPGVCYKWFKNTCKKNNLPFKTIHSFRHTIATQLANSGIAEATLTSICGWSDITSAKPYIDHKENSAMKTALQNYAQMLNVESIVKDNAS